MFSQYEWEEIVDCLPVAALIKPSSPLNSSAKRWIQEIVRRYQQSEDGEGSIHNKLLKELSPQFPEEDILKLYAYQIVRKDPSYVQLESRAKL